MDWIAHAGHALYDHPAMIGISLAALIIPLLVLAYVGRFFWRASKDDPDRKD